MQRTVLAMLLAGLFQLGLPLGNVFAQQELFQQQPPAPNLQAASGMLLGVYAHASDEGLKIAGTIPGYSAEGRLFAGDLIRQVTAANFPVFAIRSHQDMETAKTQIGPFREAAVEFFRPNVGLMYAWVIFKPIGDATPQPAVSGQAFTSGQLNPSGNFAFQQPFANPNNSQVKSATAPVGGGFGFPPSGFNPGPGQNPNSVVMKMTLDPQGPNPNAFQPRSGQFPAGPGGNPNSQQLRSGRVPGGIALNPNNDTPMALPPNPNNSSFHSSKRGFQAEFKLESEKPGARLLFRNPGQPSQNTFVPQSTQGQPFQQFPRSGIKSFESPGGQFPRQRGFGR